MVKENRLGENIRIISASKFLNGVGVEILEFIIYKGSNISNSLENQI
jgi:hypothetical protein